MISFAIRLVQAVVLRTYNDTMLFLRVLMHSQHVFIVDVWFDCFADASCKQICNSFSCLKSVSVKYVCSIAHVTVSRGIHESKS